MIASALLAPAARLSASLNPRCACARSALPAWRIFLLVGFWLVGSCLNAAWGYKLFRGAFKLLSSGAHTKGS